MWDTWYCNKPPRSATDVHGGPPQVALSETATIVAIHTAVESILDVMGDSNTK